MLKIKWKETKRKYEVEALDPLKLNHLSAWLNSLGRMNKCCMSILLSMLRHAQSKISFPFYETIWCLFFFTIDQPSKGFGCDGRKIPFGCHQVVAQTYHSQLQPKLEEFATIMTKKYRFFPVKNQIEKKRVQLFKQVKRTSTDDGGNLGQKNYFLNVFLR